MKILIADDSALLRERIISRLSKISSLQIVGEAENTIEAKKSITTLNPDIILLDIRMPGGSSIELLKTIKKEKPRSIVIIFTNYPYPQYKQRSLAEGADYFFSKTNEFEQLILTVERLVSEEKFNNNNQTILS